MYDFQLTLAQEALQLLRMEEEKERTKVANLQTSLNDAVELLQTKKKYYFLDKNSRPLPDFFYFLFFPLVFLNSF